MVAITITTQAGSRRIDLPSTWAGKSLIVYRKGSGFLKSSDYSNLDTGGILLSDSADALLPGETVFFFEENVFTGPGSLVISSFNTGLLKQYPHILTYSEKGTSVRDEKGDWIPGVNADPVDLICRAEPASGFGYMKAVDGTAINYSWIVYMPLSNDTLNIGENVTVRQDVTILLTDKIKRFSRGQLNMRAWL